MAGAEAPPLDVVGIRDVPSDVAIIRDATPVFTERQDELLDCAQQCLRDVVLEAGDTPLDLKGLFERCTARARRAASEEKAAPAATHVALDGGASARSHRRDAAAAHRLRPVRAAQAHATRSALGQLRGGG